MPRNQYDILVGQPPSYSVNVIVVHTDVPMRSKFSNDRKFKSGAKGTCTAAPADASSRLAAKPAAVRICHALSRAMLYRTWRQMKSV